MQSMMKATKWDDERTHRLWMEAATTATKHDSIMNESGETSPHQKFYNEAPAFKKHLKTFGQVGVVTLKPGRLIIQQNVCFLAMRQSTPGMYLEC